MKIKKIRLHPFAGFSDKTFEFDHGLNLMSAANETGKSTLFSAISAVLLIKSNHTMISTEDNRLIKRFKPQPGGNEICITLDFTDNGLDYNLFKKWDVSNLRKNVVTLSSAGLNYTGNEAEDHLQKLLHLNRASWKHMLFIEQSSIHQTVTQLQTQMQSMDRIQTLIGGAGRFDSDQFIQLVDRELQDYEKRWDIIMNLPQQGRGIDNPYVNDVGLILKAWYEKEKCNVQYRKILDDEIRIGELNENIRLVSDQKNKLDDFILAGDPLVMDANRSIHIINEKQSLENDCKELSEIQLLWLNASGKLPGLNDTLEQARLSWTSLQEELKNANKRLAADAVLLKNMDVQASVKKMSEKRAILDAMPNITEARFQEASAAEIAIRDARLVLEAQQLRATIESSENVRVTASIPGHEPQEIVLQPGISETLSSRGSISISYGSVHMRVVSGNVDVDMLERSISEEENKIRAICEEYGVEDFNALRNCHYKLLEETRIFDLTKGQLTALLGVHTLEQWNQNVAEANQIPNARDTTVLQALLVDLGATITKCENDIREISERVHQYEQQYQDQNTLLNTIIQKRADIRVLEAEAATLKPLPIEFNNPNQFLMEIQNKRQTRDGLVTNLSQLEVERGMLMGRLEGDNFSTEELYEKLQVAEMTYHNHLAHAQALRRIKQVHQNMNINQFNPFEAVGKRITELVKLLSGQRYSEVDFSREQLPCQIGNENSKWEIDLLSKGMKGSLALAVRLAYAEVYLGNMDGFLMLDDPLTELDSDRRKLAIEELKKFALKKQIIMFTCHEEQEKLFLGENVNLVK